ncbi:MAG: long-chain fatty acid--CoA ligase, partial [Desulfobacterales bacterium]|nr:long-chain fatty acid--CoA ligase [Desulfobacterales bacterium]
MAGEITRFPDLFFHQVNRLGDRVALRHKDMGIWNRISWNEYGQSVREVSAGFLSYDLAIGDRISILGDNRPEWLICHMGAMTAGGVTCGIYPTSSSEEIEYVVSHSEARVLFVENEEQVEKILQVIDNLDVAQVVIWDSQGLWGFSHPRIIFYEDFLKRGKKYLHEHPDAVNSRMAEIKPDDTAMFIYTSGTTGRPKGAMISHKNILSVTESFISAMGGSEKDELLSYLPLAHIYENLISVFQAIWTGATVNFVESLDTLAFNLREISPTVFASVPRIWEKFVSMVEIKMADSTILKRASYRLALNVGLKRCRTPEGTGQRMLLSLAYWPLYWGVLYHLRRQIGFERIRYAVCGAAPASPELFEWFNAIGVPLREGYGQTESTGIIAMQRIDNPQLGYVGEAMPGIEIKIAEDGEILARGPGIFKGYFKAPELTAETIVNGWLHTGDVGALEDGFLKIMDRKKDIIITHGGKNITPAFIENKLKFSVYIQDAVVIGDRKKYLTALILIDEDNVTKYAQDEGVPFTTFADLTQNTEINKLIKSEVDKVNKTLARVETIKKFRLLPRRFYAEDGDVTPTQKVKRRTLE